LAQESPFSAAAATRAVARGKECGQGLESLLDLISAIVMAMAKVGLAHAA